MVELSLLIPLRGGADNLPCQVASACVVLQRLVERYEIVCIDDSSDAATQQCLAELASANPALRIVRVEPAQGLSVALSAGISAARGEIVVATEAGNRYPAEGISDLVQHLGRADFACGRRRRAGWRKLGHRLLRIPRWVVLGLDVRDPECVFWAARREAIQGIQLPRGMYRYLPTLVARRGFRVSEIYVEYHHSPRGLRDKWPNPADLLATWWLARRLRPSDDEQSFAANSHMPSSANGAVGSSLPEGAIAGRTDEHRANQPRRRSA